MQKTAIPISDVINRPKLNWLKMKIEAYKRLDENNRMKQDEAYKDKLPRIGDHIYRTVDKLITLYIKKFGKGEIKDQKLRFTYSYLKKHADSRYCVRTFMNHLNTIASAYHSIFSNKFRDTLGLPNKDCNCVCLEFAPGVVIFENPAHNAIHLSDFKVPIKYGNVSSNEKSAPTVPYYLNKNLFAHPDERAGGAKKLGDLLGGLF